MRNKALPYYSFLVLLWLSISPHIQAQPTLQFDGQVSAITSFSPDNTLDFFGGFRYIPELNFDWRLDSAKNQNFYLEGSANISGSTGFHPFDTSHTLGKIDPYRIFVRYTGKRLEARLGLQKIDFGSSSIMRPLQWFNQIDPRDPLTLTNGVYAALGRYYFKSNANIWLWFLYQNEKSRGFDIMQTNKNIPEYGSRIQHPIPKGEIGFSYHHRTADSRNLPGIPSFEKIPEDRFGIDGKWDIGVGLWLEAVHIIKSKEVDFLTNQSLFNVGLDYTLGIGNGLHVIGEHMLLSYDKKAFEWSNPVNISALALSYPLTLFDNISCFANYQWSSKEPAFFLNYQHQFAKVTGYVMAYYNPKTQQGIQQNELIQTFSGPGLRLMVVYNH
ncbi:MAG: hypothetical protein WAT79_06360 [Saprospiraceae bacterium]